MKKTITILSLILATVASFASNTIDSVKRVAVIGPHGSGKTTLCFMIATQMKRAGYNAFVLQEGARECPFEINESQPLEASLWIAHQQITGELEAIANGYNSIICDRSSIDAFIYGQENFERIGYSISWMMDWFQSYDQIIYVIADEDLDPDSAKKDTVRSYDEEFLAEIKDRFSMFIKAQDNKNNWIQTVKFSDIKNNSLSVYVDQFGKVKLATKI